MQNLKENIIVDKTFSFSLEILKYAELLEAERKFVLCNQLLRAGTSMGANVREAQNAESNLDFIHKMKVAAKEADECEYWLLLCKHSNSYPPCDQLLREIGEIIRILSKIIGTSKLKQKAKFQINQSAAVD